jgi:hypothetical protein
MQCNKTITLFIMGVFLKKKKLLTLFLKKQSVSMLTLFLGLMRVETASSEEQIV